MPRYKNVLLVALQVKPTSKSLSSERILYTLICENEGGEVR